MTRIIEQTVSYETEDEDLKEILSIVGKILPESFYQTVYVGTFEFGGGKHYDISITFPFDFKKIYVAKNSIGGWYVTIGAMAGTDSTIVGAFKLALEGLIGGIESKLERFKNHLKALDE